MRRFPLSYGAAAELVPTVVAELQLCGIRKDDVVAIHADSQSHPHYPAAFLGAAVSLGAKVFQILTPATVQDDPSLSRAWAASDLIIDLRIGAGLGVSPLAAAALSAGRRILSVSEPVDVLRQLFPEHGIVEKTRAAGRRLDRGRVIHLMSPHGTDLVMSKAGRPGIDQHGFSEEPGRWDRWPSSRVVCAPIETSAEGRLAVQAGDLWLWGRYVDTPVDLLFERGRLASVEGKGPDATLIREWFDHPADAGSHTLAGVSWGCDPRARWERVAMRFVEPGGAMEVASRDGAVVVIFGDNTSPMLRGENVTAARLAIALRDHSVAVDGESVVERGVTVL